MLRSSRFLIIFVAMLLLSGQGLAQHFGGSFPAGAAQTPAQPTQPERRIAPSGSAPHIQSAPAISPLEQSASEEENEDDDDNETSTPAPAAFQIKFIGNDVIVDDKPKILLYMRDFKISRDLNGTVNCDMRFYARSNLSEKITNISYRLKWPNIETALSFDNVAPNTAAYYDYSLLGNGCYNMDKAPNITVNRCRVRGMSQQDCANTIEWLN